MKMNTVKIIALAAVVSTQLIGGVVYASHELENQAAVAESTDGHMSWHEFRHELGVFVGVTASMDHHGVVTLAGHADDNSQKNLIERLASKIRGASDIRSTISAD